MTKREAVAQTIRNLLAGHSPTDVKEWLAEEAKPFEPEAIIREALEALRLLAAEPADTKLGFCQEAARDLYRRSIEVGDFAGALAALKEFAKLSNLYSAGRTRRPASPPDVEQLLAELTRANG